MSVFCANNVWLQTTRFVFRDLFFILWKDVVGLNVLENNVYLVNLSFCAYCVLMSLIFSELL